MRPTKWAVSVTPKTQLGCGVSMTIGGDRRYDSDDNGVIDNSIISGTSQ